MSAKRKSPCYIPVKVTGRIYSVPVRPFVTGQREPVDELARLLDRISLGVAALHVQLDIAQKMFANLVDNRKRGVKHL